MSQPFSVERLYRRMEMESVKASELAERTGLSRQAIYNILGGRSQPKEETLRKICDALHCGPNSLLGRDEFHTDHDRFADMILARWHREVDFDAKTAIVEYVSGWLAECYSDLDHEQYAVAKAEADSEGQEFAGTMDSMLRCFSILGVNDETQAQATHQAFSLFFTVLSTIIDEKVVGFSDVDIFDLEEMR